VLRTMITDAPFEQRWVLQGRLAGQWVVDLEQRWEETRDARQGRRCVVDLEDVTWVDGAGERLLTQMLSDGCELVASRAYMKYLLEGLKRNGESREFQNELARKAR
jgi:ABC-type transporter Mla MlaB component